MLVFHPSFLYSRHNCLRRLRGYSVVAQDMRVIEKCDNDIVYSKPESCGISLISIVSGFKIKARETRETVGMSR